LHSQDATDPLGGASECAWCEGALDAQCEECVDPDADLPSGDSSSDAGDGCSEGAGSDANALPLKSALKGESSGAIRKKKVCFLCSLTFACHAAGVEIITFSVTALQTVDMIGVDNVRLYQSVPKNEVKRLSYTQQEGVTNNHEDTERMTTVAAYFHPYSTTAVEEFVDHVLVSLCCICGSICSAVFTPVRMYDFAVLGPAPAHLGSRQEGSVPRAGRGVRSVLLRALHARAHGAVGPVQGGESRAAVARAGG
jgi:hypothetical protein